VFEGFADLPGHCGWLVAGDERRPVPAAPGSHADFYPAVLAALTGPPSGWQTAMPVDPWDAVAVAAVIDAARLSAERSGAVVPVSSPQGTAQHGKEMNSPGS